VSATTIDFGGTFIGPGHDPFVIAEMSGNHNGDRQRALDIVRAIAASGASAVKLQTYTADTMTIAVDAPRFRISDDHGLWAGRSLHDLYDEAHTPWQWHEEIFGLAAELGLLAFSTPFDATAVAYLEELGVPGYKVASSEIVDIPLIRTVAATGKPVIISTGMASLAEIDAAIRAARATGNQQIIVLACTASYPAPPEASNLRSIPVLRDALGSQVGLSDHTTGIGASVAAVALGATVIEKHVTLRRSDGGVDSAFSLEPEELATLVRECRTARLALGRPVVGPRVVEAEGRRFRRSLFVVEDVRAGERVSRDNVRAIRPAGGLLPDEFSSVEGRPFAEDAPRGTPLTWDLL